MGGVGDIMTVMLVLAGAYILLKSGKLEEILGGDFKLPELPGLPAPTVPAQEGGEEEGAPAAGPSGPISTGGTCPGGESCKQDGQGRYDCDAAKPDAYEATWCGSFSGDQMTIKLYGPKHSGSSCCWCNLIVHEDGTFAVGGEGPHPNSNCEHKKGGSIGTTSNICVKAVIEPGPRWRGYGLVNGQWKEMISHSGPCGCSQKATKKTGDQVTFRVDGNFQTKCATVRPLGGGGAGAPAPAAPAKRTIGAGAVRIRHDHEYDSILSRL